MSGLYSCWDSGECLVCGIVSGSCSSGVLLIFLGFGNSSALGYHSNHSIRVES